jgi:integrase
MPRPPGVQITRDRRKDGSITFGLRVRIRGADERVRSATPATAGTRSAPRQPASNYSSRRNSANGPREPTPAIIATTTPTFRELATDWLELRRRNPAIRGGTIQNNEWQLKRYLAPFFGELRPSQITTTKIKEYRQRIHAENEQIRSAEHAGRSLRDARTDQPLRTLANASINKTLQTLAMILDDAEDEGWIERNIARGRRTREPLERRRTGGALEVDEFLAILEAAEQLDYTRHNAATLEKAALVRLLRDEARLPWKRIANRIGVAPTTAIYLHGCDTAPDEPAYGVRRAIIAMLGLAGPRVTELCRLDNQDIDLGKARLHVADAKTEASIRSVDIHPDYSTSSRATANDVVPARWTAPPFQPEPDRAATRTTSAPSLRQPRARTSFVPSAVSLRSGRT